NTEQMNMVRGIGRPPYTVQYVGTPAYLYPLQQMLNYTIGWPVMICAFIGIVVACKRQFRSLNISEIIILAWALACFFVIGGYQVKFPRYLAPIYPVVFIFAGYGLIWIKDTVIQWYRVKSFAYAILIGVLTLTIVRGLAHVSIYRENHSY